MPDLDPTVRALLDANLAVARELDPSGVLQRLVDTARELIGARYAALGVVGPDGEHLEDFIHSGMDDETVRRIGPLPTGKGVLGVLLHQRLPLRLHDLSQHPDSVGFPEHHPHMTSLLGVPVEGRGRILGNLYLTDKADETEFSDEDRALAEALAAQAAVAIENARLYAHQRRQAGQSAALARAVGALVRERDPQTVLEVIVEAARDLADAEYAAVGLTQADGAMTPFVHAGMDPATVEAIGDYPEGRGLLRTAAVEQRALRLADLREHPASVGFPEHHPEMTSLLAVPLTSDGEVIGNLYLTNKRGAEEFGQEDEDLVHALAAQAAVALHRAHGHEREQRTIEQLRSLLRANLALTRDLDPDSVLQTLVDLARDLVDAEYAALEVLGPDGETFSRFVHSGMPPEVVERIGSLPKGLGVLRAVIVGKRPIRLRRLSEHPASVGFPPHHPPMGSFLGVPLEYQGRILGNLYLTNKRDAVEFSSEDEELVVALAAQAAVAIENAQVYARERDVVDQLRQLDAMKTEFVSLVSHELRTPLVALHSGTELLLESWDQLSRDEATQVVEAANRQATRLYELIANLLDLSRIEQGRLDLELQPVDIAPVVEEAVASVSGLTTAVDVPAGLVVHADPFYLRQALINLLVNARNYGGDEIVVTGSTTDGPGEIELVVADDGGPLDPDLAARLFDRFVRGPDVGDDLAGSGLGLALVRAFVSEFAGGVHYEFVPPRWTRFVLRLPAAAARDGEVGAPAPSHTQGPQRRGRP